MWATSEASLKAADHRRATKVKQHSDFLRSNPLTFALRAQRQKSQSIGSHLATYL
jgi:hypothetical protein